MARSVFINSKYAELNTGFQSPYQLINPKQTHGMMHFTKTLHPLVLLVFLCTLLTPSFQCHAQELLSGTVVSVMDGDTLGIRTPQKKFIKVRLYGIDAPEHRQAYGNKAKKALSQLVFRKNVSIMQKDIDKYGRLVGIVLINGKNINAQMVQLGYAWVYRWFCKEPEKNQWLKLEKEAKDKRRGLWAGKKPVPPWKWRRWRH